MDRMDLDQRPDRAQQPADLLQGMDHSPREAFSRATRTGSPRRNTADCVFAAKSSNAIRRRPIIPQPLGQLVLGPRDPVLERIDGRDMSPSHPQRHQVGGDAKLISSILKHEP
jgi:hypothetical protein